MKGDANHNDSDPASVVAKIAKAPISPTLSISGWTYGDDIQELTYRFSVNPVRGDDLDITLTTKAGATSEPGEYPITIQWHGNGNYKAVLKDGVYTISKRPVVVAANAQTIQAGDRIDTGVDQATATGLAEGHRLSAVKLTAASTASNAGIIDVIMTTSTIIASDAKIEDAKGKDVTENYAITYAPGKLTIVNTRIPIPTKSPARPTAEPTAKPTAKPTPRPTVNPPVIPTVKPTAKPTSRPTAKPTAKPTSSPTAKPTAAPVWYSTPSPGGLHLQAV